MQTVARADRDAAYAKEIVENLARLSPVELNTLRHLVRHDMQVFTADRHSVVLATLTRRSLLNPMGSNVYPDDAYPYRVPDPVWAELRRREAKGER